MKNQSNFFKLLLASLLVCALPFVAKAESETAQKVAAAMSGYHFQAKPDVLEGIAGGQDQLVAALTELRTDNNRPFVGIRAERMLLLYADREDVQKTLLEDVNSVEYKGLARTITTHIDSAPEKARRVLGQAAVERAKRDTDFSPYAKSMQQSTDPEVQRMTKSLFE